MTIRWRASALLALAYFATGELGRTFQLFEVSEFFIWPPVGISLAAVLLFGPGLWPGVAVGGLASIAMFDVGLPAAAWLAVLQVAEVLLAWWLLHAVFRFRTSLSRVRDVVALAATALGTSLFSAGSGVVSLAMFDAGGQQSQDVLFHSWWWSHVSADLIIAPALMTWWRRSARHDAAARPGMGELAALVLCAVLAAVALFNGTLFSWLPGSQAPLYMLPLPVWAGLRFGPRGAATATFAIGCLAIAAVTTGRGPFVASSDLEAFVSLTSVSALLLSALAVEKDRASLRRSAIQLAALDAIVSLDADDTIVEFNPSAEQMFGYRTEDVLGKSVRMLLPDADQAEHFPGRLYNTTARRANGSEFPVEVSLAAVTFDGEDIRTGFIRDRTEELRLQRERMQAQVVLEEKVAERTTELMRINHELERSESLLRQAEELAELGSFELDLTTGRFLWSDELYRIFGRDRAKFTPSLHAFFQAVHSADRADVRATLSSAVEHVQPFSVEGRIVRPDGAVRTLMARGKVYRDGAPVAARVAGCCQDVSQQYAAEQLRFRLVDIAESSEDPIIGLTPQGEIESWNPAASNVFGYTRAEVIGKPSTILVAADGAAEVRERIRLAATGRHLSHYELPHCRKDGTVFEASVTTSAIRDRQGNVIGLSKVLRDITAQKSFERQLKVSLEEKEALLREIHHRVKNNLQVISSLLNLQVSTETSPQSRRSLLESQNRIQSMALVHQLLYQSTDIGRIDLTSYVRTLATQLLRTYNVGPKRIDLTVQGPAILLGVDSVIPCGLIVNELVANAIDHAFPHERRGHIWVTIERTADSNVGLTVRDDGVGIADNAMESDKTFGLQIARTLTRQLDGDMTIERRDGTVVRVMFPVPFNASVATSESATVH